MTAHPSPEGRTDTTTAPTMTAIVQDRYGLPDVLRIAEVPTPQPGPNEVLVRVKASSLNIYDWHMTTGTPRVVRAIAGLRRPKHRIPGADVAGVVAATGSDVTLFSPGDEVMGDIGWGAWADYAVAKETSITQKPPGVTFEEAATVPLAGITALQALRDHGGVTGAQRVLINGASGGVGTFAVQIAKALGAEVTAVCSTGKVEQAAEIGAARVIDYTATDFTTTERDYDVLLDNAGNRPWSETSRVLAPGGINVSTTGPKHGWFGPFRNLLFRKAMSWFGNKRLTWFTAHIDVDDLVYLSELVGSGQVTPVIERTYPLDQVADALRYLGEGHAHGKLVVSIDPSGRDQS